MSSFASKTKKVKCYYCKEEMKDENLKVHCLTKHNAAKRVAGEISVSGYFASASKKLKISDAPSSSTTDESLLVETPSDDINLEEEVLEEVAVDKSDNLKYLVKIVKNIDLNLEISLNEIKLLRENISTLASKLEKKMPEFAKPDDVSPYDERTNSLYEF